MKWDREAVTALVAAWVVTGEAETIMGSQCCSLSRGSTSSKLKQKAAAQSWSHTGSCGCTDSATFAPKIFLFLLVQTGRGAARAKMMNLWKMLECSTFTVFAP